MKEDTLAFSETLSLAGAQWCPECLFRKGEDTVPLTSAAAWGAVWYHFGLCRDSLKRHHRWKWRQEWREELLGLWVICFSSAVEVPDFSEFWDCSASENTRLSFVCSQKYCLSHSSQLFKSPMVADSTSPSSCLAAEGFSIMMEVRPGSWTQEPSCTARSYPVFPSVRATWAP